jgi:hypothetical protein
MYKGSSLCRPGLDAGEYSLARYMPNANLFIMIKLRGVSKQEHSSICSISQKIGHALGFRGISICLVAGQPQYRQTKLTADKKDHRRNATFLV